MNEEKPLNPVLSPEILAQDMVNSWRKGSGKDISRAWRNPTKGNNTGAVPKRNFKSPIKVVRDEDQ
jgi:hypothetical protein